MDVDMEWYAILFAVMTTYISNLDAMGDHFRTDVQQTIAWANYRELPDELRSRILRYFSYKWRKCRGLNEVDVIEELPRSIAQDVNLEIYRSLIQKVPLFKGVEISFIRAIVKFTCAPQRSPARPATPHRPSPREAAPEQTAVSLQIRRSSTTSSPPRTTRARCGPSRASSPTTPTSTCRGPRCRLRSST